MGRRLAGTTGALPHDSSSAVSAAIRSGDFVFISGLLPRDEEGNLVTGDITHQTHAVMKRLQATLEQAGCSMEDVVKCTVWLTHVEDFADFNRVYATYFDEPRPARSTVRADLMVPAARIEIEAVCHKIRTRIYPHTYG
ncbi:MAG: RidA family protein [Rhodospirillaceae bacterium]|nr:RidA family protein [Rhodospirillaceae bacterium]